MTEGQSLGKSLDHIVPDRYNHNTHWISRQISRGLPFSSNKFLTSVIKFGLVWNILSVLYFLTQWNKISSQFLVASALFLGWVNLAPYLIWYYDELVMPRFFAKVSELVVDREALDEIAERYGRYYAQFNPWMALFWGGGFVGAGIFATGLFETQGMIGDGRVFLYTTYIYGAFVGGILGEAGFSGPITTILVIREVADLELKIQPLHPDQLGGLSTIGYYAIRTTLLWSSASLLSPMAFRMIATSAFNEVIILVTAAYIGTIVFSFVYPTLKISRRASEQRDQILDDLRQEWVKLQQNASSQEATEISNINRHLEMQQIRQIYDDYQTVRLYPMEIRILTRLVGSVLLPLFFLFLEYLLPRIF